MQTDKLNNDEMYFEVIGFEQSSAMQIISQYAKDYSVLLKLANSLPLHHTSMQGDCKNLEQQDNLGKSILPTILSQEYGIIAQGSTHDLAAFFKILESLFADRLVKGDIATFTLKKLQQHNYKLCVAESCTGGTLSAMITAISGASSVFKGGITTYSIESKQQILGIKDSIFKEHSVYSEACVSAMARGAIDLFQADIAIATSGLATHDDSPDNFLHLPAGTVFTCVLVRDRMPINIVHNYLSHTNIESKDSRIFVQKMASLQALRLLLSTLAN
ncbi:CinA family protein [Helicobacter trogontum]|uniref:CinA family protein n=1 Tax=Helicobacter trogontum TaxID=50960 RepID=UPI000A8572C0|nr:CinA family protein [Helicobacter trogontum]